MSHYDGPMGIFEDMEDDLDYLQEYDFQEDELFFMEAELIELIDFQEDDEDDSFILDYLDDEDWFDEDDPLGGSF